MNRRRVSPDVTFGDVVYASGGAFGPRIQQDYQLVLLYEGEVRIEVDGAPLVVHGQHAVLLHPQRREQFLFTRTRQTHHTWCAVAPRAVPPELRERLSRLPACLPLTSRLHGLVEYGLALPPGAGAAGDALLTGVGLAALQAFAFEAALAHLADDLPAVVRRALQFIEIHLAEPLDLERIARAASVTPQHLTRLFRRHLHTTPARHLWQLRTRRGVELLGETGLSVGEIAARVGFQSPFHFSRMVRRRYQHSPRQLRERLWRGEGGLTLDDRRLTDAGGAEDGFDD